MDRDIFRKERKARYDAADENDRLIFQFRDIHHIMPGVLTIISAFIVYARQFWSICGKMSRLFCRILFMIGY